MVTLVDPDRVDVGAQNGRQLTDGGPVFFRLRGRRYDTAELRIDLNLGRQTIIESGREKICIH